MGSEFNFEILLNPRISFDDFANVLHDAHQSNKRNGMHFSTADYTGLEIQEHIGEGGDICIIRTENELCAVGAIKYRKWDKWFCQNQLCADIMLVGVREKYKGLGLSKIIYSTLENVGFRKCNICTMNTAVGNHIMINSRLHDNWKKVDYFSHNGTDFYSIMLAKWDNQSKISDVKCKLMYCYRKNMVKLVRKKDGTFRGLFRICSKQKMQNRK